MTIKTTIQRTSFERGLLEIATGAQAKVTFWGSRQIYVSGYQGTVSIDTLTSKVMDLARSHHFEFTAQQRAIGQQVGKEITRLYEDSDLLVAKSNLITRFICGIQSFFYQFGQPWFPPRTTSLIRWNWNNEHYSGFSKVFEYQTEAQFVEKFGRQPDTWEKWRGQWIDKVKLFPLEVERGVPTFVCGRYPDPPLAAAHSSVPPIACGRDNAGSSAPKCYIQWR